MYESPVNLIIFKDIEERQIVEEQDQIILKAITKCGVDVNKDELIKAINYDRNQYSKGYKDGANDALDKIIAEIELEKIGYPPSAEYYKAIVNVLQIIDKYKAESEASK